MLPRFQEVNTAKTVFLPLFLRHTIPSRELGAGAPESGCPGLNPGFLVHSSSSEPQSPICKIGQMVYIIELLSG